MKRVILSILVLCVGTFAIEVGTVPPSVTIEGENGGKLDGSAWHSSMLQGKVYTLFYVDPDERDLNNALVDALKERKFDRKKVNSVAIINLAATWMPNMILESKLKEKQKKFPDTMYVKDKKKILVKQWQLDDDNSDILIFDKKGRVIYKKYGKVSDKEIKTIISLIEDNT